MNQLSSPMLQLMEFTLTTIRATLLFCVWLM